MANQGEVVDALKHKARCSHCGRLAGACNCDPPFAHVITMQDAADVVATMQAALKVIRHEVDPDRMRTTDHVPDGAFIWDVANDALTRATETPHG